MQLAPDARVEASLTPRLTWPRRGFGALGPAHAVPGLPQYWHPVLLDADVEGEAVLGDRRLTLDGARAYAEKNWGPGFAGRWWWGQANAFDDPDLGVAFAGGRTLLLGTNTAPTALVFRQGTACWASPAARQSQNSGGRARLARACALRPVPGRARGRRRGQRAPSAAGARRPHGGWKCARQLLAGRIRLQVRRGRRTIIDAVSPLAGLELGEEAAEVDPSSARRTAAVSASAPTSLSKGPTTAHSARSRRAALRSTGCTRASETSSARPSGSGAVQWAKMTRTAAFVPVSERTRPLEHRVIARQRPNATAQPGDQYPLVLLEHCEGICAKESAEALACGGARDAPADERAERAGLPAGAVARPATVRPAPPRSGGGGCGWRVAPTSGRARETSGRATYPSPGGPSRCI